MLSIKIVKRVQFVSQLFQLCPHECATENIWRQALRAAASSLETHRCSSPTQNNKVPVTAEAGAESLIHS